MRTFNLTIAKICLVVSFLILVHFGSYASLNGNYTINPNNAASASNYKNWASAVGDLISGTRTDGGTAQGSGVSGPVVFTVYDMVYSSTQIKITAITGASNTNTITFKSTSDSSKCVLQYPSGTSSTDDYVLMLDGADYITFSKIGFERTGSNTYYTVIQILNSADRNSFNRCWMKTRKLPSSTSLGWTTGVGAQIYFAGNGDSTFISQNRMIYGYNGIYSATSCTGNNVINNVFDTIGCIAVYMSSQTGLKINGNTFFMGDFGSGQGHYVSYAIRIESSPSLVITKNRMYMLATNCQVVRGIVFVSITGTSSLPNLVNNNWMLNSGGSSSCSGISLYGISYLDLYYNNLLITNSLGAGAIVHHNSSYTNTYVNIKNNNLINKGGGLIYDFPSTNGGLDTVLNNNCFISGSKFGNMNGTSYSTLSAWVSATGKDANSLNVDPGFVSNTDLHVSNIAINAKATPYFRVKDDIDNDTRNTSTPDIGADEFFPIANDAGISSLDSPAVFCASKKNVKITFQNYGSDTLKSLKIYWQINGNSQNTYTWSGRIDPGKSSSSITLGNYTFAQNTAYNFKIWTNSPNGSTDGNNKNDTLFITRYAGMTGTYTIGDASGTDFKSFNNAISAMTSRGICSTVTFNVYDGTYKEQITLAQLPGMGISNPVVFQSKSGDSSKVIVTLPSSTATGNNNAAVQLAGADYVTFKGITFQRTGTNSISEVVHILNNSNNNTFTNCQMINTVVTSANATGINIWSDQSQDNGNVFRYNYVKYGTYNMLYLGVSTSHESGTVVEGNVFDSAYSSAVQLGYNDGVIFKGNLFRNSISKVASNYELQLLDCDSAINIMGNYFYNANTDIAIHQTGCSASSVKHGITANNFISKASATGILLDAVNYQDVVFNNIYFSGSSATNAGISTSSSTSTNIVLKNNNILMVAGYVFYIYTSSHVSASDRNNLKGNGSQFAYWAGTYTSLSALVAASGKDKNSISVNPIFYSATDLHIKNAALMGAGEPITGVTTDIDGQTRNTTTPDIGADEFTLVPNDAGIVELIDPANPACEGYQQVKTVIKNFGKDSLKTATINWSVNSAAQTSYSWSGKLKSTATDTVVIGNFTFTGNTYPSIIIWTSSPNGKTDGFVNNDTLTSSPQIKNQPAVNAGADVNLCLGDSVQIGPASSTGYNYKWKTLSNTVIGTKSKIYVNPGTNSTYVLEITDIAAGCSNTDTLNVAVKPLPKSSFTVNSSNQCLNGNNFKFTNASTGATKYLWDFGDGDTSTSASPSHSYALNNSFTVILTSITSFGCTDTSSSVVNVRPKPVSGFTINNISQCLKSNSFNFTNTSTGQTTNYWDFGDTSYSSLASPSGKTYQFLGTKNIKLVTVSQYGCKDSITKSVDIRPLPVASFTINNNSQCLSDNNFIFTNSSSGASSYFWDFGDGVTSINISTLYVYSTSGVYNVKLVATTIYGCKDSITQSVDVKPKPVSSFTINKPVQCLGGNNYIFTNSSTGAATSLWYFGDASTSGVTSPSHTFTKSGYFNVKLVSETANGCKDSIIKMVTVYPQPLADFTINDSSQCLDDNIFIFTNTSAISSGTLNYVWNLGDGTTNFFLDNTHTYNSATNYLVKLKATSALGCSDSITKTVYVKPHPVVNLGADDTIYNAESIVLKAGTGFDSYLWSNNAITDQITVDSATFGLGLKTFWVKVTKDDCDGYDTILISIQKVISINEPQSNFDLNVYPNPANSVLNIEFNNPGKEMFITLTDMFGKELRTIRISEVNSSLIHQIDVSELAKGIYYLNVSNSENRKISKIMKY